MAWFPLHWGLLDSDEWAELTAVERVYLVEMVAAHNLYGGSAWEDTYVAAKLNVSVLKVRRARRKLGTLGLLAYTPGRRGMATTYTRVAWATAAEANGTPWTKVNHYHWATLLHYVRRRHHTHSDVVVWLALAACEAIYRRGREAFEVRKAELARLAGVSTNVWASITALRNGVQFRDGARLFDVADLYHAYRISHWATCGSPDEEASPYTTSRSYDDEILAAVKWLKGGR